MDNVYHITEKWLTLDVIESQFLFLIDFQLLLLITAFCELPNTSQIKISFGKNYPVMSILTLIATINLLLRSLARYTSPNLPRPNGRPISKSFKVHLF